MKRFLIAVGLSIALAWMVQQPVRGQAIGPYVQAACSQLASFTGTATTVLAIAGVAGKVLYLCGYWTPVCRPILGDLSMGASWWERWKLVTWYRSECGGWYVRVWHVGLH